MRKVMRYISAICAMLLLAFTGCDVHEFPVDNKERVPFTLHLDFDTEMYFYKEVTYEKNSRAGEDPTKAPIENHDVRYIINAYRTDNVIGTAFDPDTTFIFTKSDLTNLNYTAQLELPEGTYSLKVWCDFVDEGSKADKYYDTGYFIGNGSKARGEYYDEGLEGAVILKDRSHYSGNNDFRDVFRGYAEATVVNPKFYKGSIQDTFNNSATALMTRPVGKVEFISTDVEEFLSRVAALMQQQGLLSVDSDKNAIDQLLSQVDLGQFKIVISYDGYMPCAYNVVEDHAADSWQHMWFESKMHRINDTEMSLGFDYTFVGKLGTTLNMSVAVYNGTIDEENLMSRSRSIQVPFMPSKLTTVRGEFLTSIASGGVTVNPGYDGPDFNWDITDAIQ